jgi:hypothetical protein
MATMEGQKFDIDNYIGNNLSDITMTQLNCN